MDNLFQNILEIIPEQYNDALDTPDVLMKKIPNSYIRQTNRGDEIEQGEKFGEKMSHINEVSSLINIYYQNILIHYTL